MSAANLRHVQQYDWAHVAAKVRDEYLVAIAHLKGLPVPAERPRTTHVPASAQANLMGGMNGKHSPQPNGTNAMASQVDGG